MRGQVRGQIGKHEGVVLTRCLARAVVLLGVAAVGGIASPSALDAQSVPVVALKPPGARLSEEFSRIVGVRELPNRRVLVADAVEKRVVLVDFGSGSVTPAAVNGQGPTEFTNAAVIWPLGRDSSLMADMSSRRWHIFVGSRLVGMVPPDHPAHSATGSSVLGTDSLGFVLARRPIQRDHGAAHFGTLDSSIVVHVEFKSGSIDEPWRAHCRVWERRCLCGERGRRWIRAVGSASVALIDASSGLAFPNRNS